MNDGYCRIVRVANHNKNIKAVMNDFAEECSANVSSKVAERRAGWSVRITAFNQIPKKTWTIAPLIGMFQNGGGHGW